MALVLLDRNENRYGPAPGCLEILRSLPAEFLRDYSREHGREGASSLVRRLAEIHGVQERRVMLGYGSEDVLRRALSHHLAGGGRLLVPGPSWWYYRALAREMNASVVDYPLVEGATRWHYDVDELLARHRSAPAHVILIGSPNNPTGNALPPDGVRAVAVGAGDALVVLDEAYWGYCEDERPDAAALTREHRNLLVLRTFSKLYGLAGARIGYAIAGSGLDRFIERSTNYLGYCRVTEQLALAALEDDRYYRDVRRKVAEDRLRLCELLRVRRGVRVFDSDANFVLARFPHAAVGPLRATLEARGFAVKFLEEPGLEDCARITVGTRQENLRLWEVLADILPEVVEARA